MKETNRFAPWTIYTAVAISMALSSPAALSQETEDDLLEEIVTTGTRKQGQSPTETLSPIDVLAGAVLANQATFDMTDGLTKVAPSINTQRFPIADGTAFIRPVSLRNLSPDQTLVLVNGTRRHRSPLVNLQLAPLGTVNQGAQAVDFSALPSMAIKRVEVLRDGASAQYGSDAIAGVVNVILKDANEGISLSAQTGEYFEGDGTRTTIAANGGFSLGDNGFLNVTIESSTADTTSRGVQRADCQPVIDFVGEGVVPLDDLCQRWGDPDVETLKFFLNAGIDINDSTEIYGNASFSDNDTISDFFYRHPVLDPAAGVDGRNTLIIDGDGDFLPDPAPAAMVNRIIADGGDPADYLTPDGVGGWLLLNPIYTEFPGGYNPDFGAAISDMAFVFGVRGETGGGMSWDIRGRVAESEADYTLSETINPSLGALSPTSFKPGKLTQEETSLNADFVQTFDVGNLASPLNFAFGVEWREETYKIGAGDPASRNAGPAFEFGVGSDGFQGFPTASAGSFDSASYAVYVDVEADLTDNFTLGGAVRYEDYDEFGDTTDFKVSGRVQISDQFALRATASTGFRAPTPGQVNTLNTTTSADTDGNLIPSGTYPVGSTVAMVLGSEPLTPEESTSFTLGVIWSPADNVNITLDYYDISIDDRLALFNTTITAQDVADLILAGVDPIAAGLLLDGIANYFANAFDSDVTGVDLAITADFEVGSGDLIVDLRHNQNEQDVPKVAAGTINASRVFDLENQVPDSRTTLTFDYDSGSAFSGYLRINNYGSWKSTGGLFSAGDASDVSNYGSEILVDLEASYRFNDMIRLSVGAENVFDAEPDSEGDGTLAFLGANTSITSPFGNNGGFWYARLVADF
ncbi:MAG: TonB-dependent receptor [Gammaproteobacteria bacterium]|jgi:iron complex outermembrane receptor protein|nr:TonB-dependent receptor [Gammaproteobacteria bacterium]MDH3750501.1 TonB-dependent receptor [Gammaproteobacteria bacterium]MDH3806402.1 TonB-dependent receptor [Gammaproteobacteria bacterium]